jgi:hypothetical protein
VGFGHLKHIAAVKNKKTRANHKSRGNVTAPSPGEGPFIVAQYSICSSPVLYVCLLTTPLFCEKHWTVAEFVLKL